MSTSPTLPKATTLSSITHPSDPESSVARGTRYEHLCSAVLHHIFGMHLSRTGGAGDRGIDLRGWWQPPSPQQRRIRIVAQCKCQDEGGKKMGPVLVREVEGVVFRASATSQGEEGVLAGVMLSSSGFSKQALLQVRSSSVPLVAMHVRAQKQGDEDEGKAAALVERCVSIVWNDRFGAADGGLLEGGLEVRWVRSLSPQKGGGMEETLGRPVIYRAGKPLSK